ncbi:MAG: hypothetical protein AB7V42_12090 [Thermoleophilia bacterium]
MPGGRPISGDDVRAALRAPTVPIGAWEPIAPGEVFESYEDLRRRFPPARLGISSGVHAALLGPLFGEFE